MVIDGGRRNKTLDAVNPVENIHKTPQGSCHVQKEVSNPHKVLFVDWVSLYDRLNSHYEAWSYKKKRHKNIKAYRKSF